MRITTSGENQYGGGRRVNFSLETVISGNFLVVNLKFCMHIKTAITCTYVPNLVEIALTVAKEYAKE